MHHVEFVDTSVLLNLCAVPGKCQQRAEVDRDFTQKKDAGVILILPITAVIETGNHIEQSATGRRKCATALERILASVEADDAPWTLNQVAWDADFLKRLRQGLGTGATLLDLLGNQQIGTGDLSILVERDLYRDRVRVASVGIWTYDETLRSYA